MELQPSNFIAPAVHGKVVRIWNIHICRKIFDGVQIQVGAIYAFFQNFMTFDRDKDGFHSEVRLLTILYDRLSPK